MSLQASFYKRTFSFRFDARTSRGAMPEKVSWFLRVWRAEVPNVVGEGECGPLPGLSIDHSPMLQNRLEEVAQKLATIAAVSAAEAFSIAQSVVPEGHPALLFAVETALLDLAHGGRGVIFENQFLHGQRLPINGLVWMGDEAFMLKQVHDKVQQGFPCIKLKIGGLDFEQECAILHRIRAQYPDITLRLDANGAFTPQDAMDKLERLAQYRIHSLEQPIKPRHAAMATLCATSPIPIALDEELIGQEGNKQALLERLRPPYIILKPSLHGGLAHSQEWIAVAESLGADWWITSALESNVGLNAICQFTANYPVTLPQGLGTGALYADNFPSALTVEAGTIFLRGE